MSVTIHRLEQYANFHKYIAHSREKERFPTPHNTLEEKFYKDLWQELLVNRLASTFKNLDHLIRTLKLRNVIATPLDDREDAVVWRFYYYNQKVQPPEGKYVFLELQKENVTFAHTLVRYELWREDILTKTLR